MKTIFYMFSVAMIVYMMLILVSIFIDLRKRHKISMVLKKGIINRVEYHPGMNSKNKKFYSEFFREDQVKDSYLVDTVVLIVLVPFMDSNYKCKFRITDMELGLLYKVGSVVQVKVRVKDKKIVGYDRKFIL